MNQAQLDRNFKLLYYQVGANVGEFAKKIGIDTQEVVNILKGFTHVDQKILDSGRIVYGVDLTSDTPKIARVIRGTITSRTTQDNFIRYIRHFNIPQKYIASFFGMHLQTLSNIVQGKGKLPRMVSYYFDREWGINLSDENLDVTKLSIPKELMSYLEEHLKPRMDSRIEEGTGVRQNFINLYKSTNMSVAEFAKSLGYKSGTNVSSVLSGAEVTRPMVCAVQQRYGVDITSPDFTLDVHENTKEESLENFKYVLNTTGLSMTAFAKELGVDLTMISHILKGRRPVTRRTVNLIQLKYKVDLLHDTKDEVKEKLAANIGNVADEKSYVILDGATFETIKTSCISHYLAFNYGERKKNVKVYRQITV